MLGISKTKCTGAGTRRVSLPLAVLLTAFTLFMLTAGSPAAYAQPEKIQLEHWGNGGAVKTTPAWRNGNLNPSNSHYWEGDADPVRMIFDNLTPGETYTVTFDWLAAKKQGNGSNAVKHAHDFLVNYTFSEYPAFKPTDASVPNLPSAAYPDPCKPRVQGGGKGPNVCELTSVPTDIEQILLDNHGTGVSARQTAAGVPQYFSIWNANIDSITDYSYFTNPTSNNAENFTRSTYIRMSITFTVATAGTGAGLLGDGEGVVLAFGGHLAKGSGSGGWGTGQGAADIHGAPYHWSYEIVQNDTGAKIAKGSRDRSIMLRRNGHIQIVKECVNERPTDGNFQFSATNAPNVLPEDGLPKQFTLDCDEADTIEQSAGINGGSGSYSITETIQAGFAVTEIVCEILRPSGELLGEKLLTVTVNGGTPKLYPGDLPAAGPGSVTATFEFNAGEIVRCTFTNTRPRAVIELTPNEGTNLINEPHTITAEVFQDDGSGTPEHAPDGTKVEFSLIPSDTNAIFVGGVDECTTTAGVCSIQIVSAEALVVDIHATSTFKVFGIDVTATTGTHVTGDETTDARKTYVEPENGVLTIIKCVVNDDGRTAGPRDFLISVNGTEIPWGTKPAPAITPQCPQGYTGVADGFVVEFPLQTDANGVIELPYEVTEALLEGYSQVLATAGCDSSFVSSGQQQLCIIVNDDRLDGRMTGGGSVFFNKSQTALVNGKKERTRITHGFELHCDLRPPNRLEVVWHDGADAFHLETLTYARCQDHPDYDPENPDAEFDTFYGSGTGRINNNTGNVYTIDFKLTDKGERGSDDTAEFIIRLNGNVVLSSQGEKILEFGNHQAHLDNK